MPACSRPLQFFCEEVASQKERPIVFNDFNGDQIKM